MRELFQLKVSASCVLAHPAPHPLQLYKALSKRLKKQAKKGQASSFSFLDPMGES